MTTWKTFMSRRQVIKTNMKKGKIKKELEMYYGQQSGKYLKTWSIKELENI